MGDDTKLDVKASRMVAMVHPGTGQTIMAIDLGGMTMEEFYEEQHKRLRPEPPEVPWDKQERGSWQFERGRRAGRQEILEVLQDIIDHTYENSEALLQWPSSRVEARCREWGAMLLEEALHCVLIADDMRKHNTWFARVKALMGKIEEHLAEDEDEMGREHWMSEEEE